MKIARCCQKRLAGLSFASVSDDKNWVDSSNLWIDMLVPTLAGTGILPISTIQVRVPTLAGILPISIIGGGGGSLTACQQQTC